MRMEVLNSGVNVNLKKPMWTLDLAKRIDPETRLLEGALELSSYSLVATFPKVHSKRLGYQYYSVML